MATRCPRPWACSARRLGRLGRRLSRASHHAPDRPWPRVYQDDFDVVIYDDGEAVGDPSMGLTRPILAGPPIPTTAPSSSP
jgi:hypothetical protein